MTPQDEGDIAKNQELASKNNIWRSILFWEMNLTALATGLTNQHKKPTPLRISLKFDKSKVYIYTLTSLSELLVSKEHYTPFDFGLIRQLFLDLWSLESPDFSIFLMISVML